MFKVWWRQDSATSTLEGTRTHRFIDIAKRGNLPIPIRYYAAHTGRWGGADKINIQNLPSRGPDGKKLKNNIIAPEGYKLIDGDSAQIEARVLAWLAEQDDLVEAFTNGEDVYKKMASRIPNVAEADVTKDQRFVGKTTILGARYGMGAVVSRSVEGIGSYHGARQARRVIQIYRESNWKISHLWREAQNMLVEFTRGNAVKLGRAGVINVDPVRRGVKLPQVCTYVMRTCHTSEKKGVYNLATRLEEAAQTYMAVRSLKISAKQ